jgi:equilibrative nucleoside transporter 1/2/3
VPLLDALPAGRGALGGALVPVAAAGAAAGLAQGALFGEAARLPPRSTRALVGGTSVSGVAAAALRVATKAALPPGAGGLYAGAALCFALAAATFGACFYTYLDILPRLLAERLAAEELALAPEGAAGAAPLGSVDAGQERAKLWGGGGEGDAEGGADAGGLGSDFSTALFDCRAPSSLDFGAEGGGDAGVLRRVAHSIRAPACAVALVYVVALSIFPGVLAEDVASARLGSWYAVLLLALFNAADCAGKWLEPPCVLARGDSGVPLVAAAAARALFLPAFYAAAHAGPGVGPAAVAALTAALGVSNGWLTSSAMVAAPLASGDPPAAPLVGNLVVLALVSGPCVGAACGFLWLL